MADEKDIERLIALLDGYEGNRMTIQVVEASKQESPDGDSSMEVLKKAYHHGRCDVGSPFADGTCI